MIQRQRINISPIRLWEIGNKKAWREAPERCLEFEVNAGSGAIHFEEKVKKVLILY
jgi:hypothetical protein